MSQFDTYHDIELIFLQYAKTNCKRLTKNVLLIKRLNLVLQYIGGVNE